MGSHQTNLALVMAIAVFLAACTAQTAEPATPTTVPSQPTSTSTTIAATTTTTTAPIDVTTLELTGLGFDQFVDRSYGILLARNPQFLTSLGIADRFDMRNDQLTDMSAGYTTETEAIESVIHSQIQTYNRDDLGPAQQTSYDVYEWYLETQVAGHQFRYHEWPVHYFANSYNTNLIILLLDEHQIANHDDAADYISRLNQVDSQVAQVIDELETAVALGMVPPTTIIDWTLTSLRNDIGGTPRADAVTVEKLPLYTSFEERLNITTLSTAEREDLLSQASTALEESFVPGWIDLYDYMVDLLEVSSEEPGAGRLPDGADYYNWLLRLHTSTNLTADEVHQLGHDNVERVETELRQAFDELGYPADETLPALVAKAADEAGYLSGNGEGGVESILETNNSLIANAEETLRPLFGLWPEATVEVVPDAGGGGFYIPASVDGARPGKFHAGTGGQVPLLTTPTVNYHEAVSGHHTQIALSQELDLPDFRRFIQYNAYIEGWALYSEDLAYEAGLYEDDALGNVGRLELELLRAVRLVVDTGIHSKGWSQAEAHQYMDKVIPLWGSEVERYMAWPGQATGYMIGMQEILRMREDAQAQLGESYDIVSFHDAVLGSGSLPLSILDDVVSDYVGTTSSQ